MSEYRRPDSVLIVVCTLRGEVLVMERVKPQGVWQSITGSLQWHESPLEAAGRELLEETGFAGDLLEDCCRQNRFELLPGWGNRRFAPEVTHNLEHVFRLLLPVRRAVTINADEHVDYAWLPRAEAAAKVFSWSNRDAINELVPVIDVDERA